MSRSALAVAAVLFALGALVWLLSAGVRAPALTGADSRPAPAVAGPSSGPAAAPALPGAPARASREPPGAAPGGPPRIANRDDLVKALTQRGLDAERLLDSYQEWRVVHGFLGADPLTGITAENAPAQTYAAMDRATQKLLAASGDLGAIQAYAAGSLPGDPLTAMEYYGRASELGSAAAMGEMASILTAFGGPAPGADREGEPAGDPLRALRGGDANRDLRADAAAWTLAAIRQHGPLVATPGNLEPVNALAASGNEALVTTICARSLAILADLSAANAGRSRATLPPVFLAEQGLYDRLPCRGTPAPVMPPRGLENCTASAALVASGQPVELWICEET